MNKRLFIGATALTAVTVAGVVYYRHVILDKLSRVLYPQESMEKEAQQFKDLNEQDDLSPEAIKFLDEVTRESDTWKTGKQLHEERPENFGPDGRPIRKPAMDPEPETA